VVVNFSEVFARVKQLVTNFLASRKILDFYTHRCDSLDRQIDARGDVLHALSPDEIRIVESAPSEAPARPGSATK